MPALICQKDQQENAAQALSCSRCGAKLSRVVVGRTFVQRYRVLSCLGDTETGFRYLAQFARSGESCVLHEIIPSQARERSVLAGFDRAAQHLIDTHPKFLAPTLEHFSYRSCYYTVESRSQGKNLRATIEREGAYSEPNARGLLAALLTALTELYSLDPPIYIAAPHPEKILLTPKGLLVFLESSYVADIATGVGPRPMKEVLAKDLAGSAQVVVFALAGAVAPSASRVDEVASSVKALSLGCTLDWILHPNGHMIESLAKLEQFRGLVEAGEAKMKEGDTAGAIELLAHAHHLSGLRRVQDAIDGLEKSRSSKPTEQPEQTMEGVGRPPDDPPKSETAPEETKEQPTAPEQLGWTCSKCHTENLADSQFCEHCGASREPRPGEQPKQVPKPKAQEELTPPKKSQNKLRIWVAAAALVIAIVAIAFWVSGSLMRAFTSSIEKGQLVSPPGESAYDIYKRALSADGANSSRVREMNARARPLLERMSNEQFDRWYQKSDLSDANWRDLAKAADWLSAISPSDSVLHSRKEYADAQIQFLEGHFSEALNGFQRSLQLNPSWDSAMIGVGKSCYHLKRYSCTEEYYARARQASPNWIWPHRNLMELYVIPQKKNLSAACAEYRSLMSLSASMSPPPFDRESIQHRMEGPCRNK